MHPRVPLSTWFRYRAAAEQTQASILLLTQHPCAKSSVELLLRLQPGNARRDEATVFTGIEHEIEVVRRRFAQAPTNVIPLRKPPQRATIANWREPNHLGRSTMTKPAELYACLYAKEFPAQAFLRLRPELRDKPCVVMDGEPPLQQVCSLTRKARTARIGSWHDTGGSRDLSRGDRAAAFAQRRGGDKGSCCSNAQADSRRASRRNAKMVHFSVPSTLQEQEASSVRQSR